jgi:hypothetical protein
MPRAVLSRLGSLVRSFAHSLRGGQWLRRTELSLDWEAGANDSRVDAWLCESCASVCCGPTRLGLLTFAPSLFDFCARNRLSLIVGIRDLEANATVEEAYLKTLSSFA